MRKSARRGERGIALMLVIGLICILMISAVAFAISMRIERQGAYNYRYGVQARHLLWSALSEALSDINLGMDDGMIGSTHYAIYPEWSVLASTSDDPGVTKRARVLSISGTNYVPYDLWIAATNARAYYRSVADTNNWRFGRYAYIAVNMSGLLDANMVGGVATRANGASPQEIQIDQLPELQGDGAAFAARRSVQMGRYDSLGEMTALNDAFHGHDPVNNFAIYSLARNDEVLPHLPPLSLPPPNGRKKVYIGGDIADLKAREIEIKAAFTACGVKDPNLAYMNLLDYVDSDSIPNAGGTLLDDDARLGIGLVEAVPMINDFLVRYTCSYSWDSNTCNLAVSAPTLISSVETIYEFDQSSSEKYKLHCILNVIPDSAPPVFLPGSGPQPLASYPVTPFTPNKYQVWPLGPPFLAGSGGTTPLNPGVALTNSFRVSLAAYITIGDNAGGIKVDQVPVPWNGGTTGIITTVKFVVGPFSASTLAPIPMASNYWTECIDPRFNWSPAGKWLSYDNVNAIPGLTPKFTTWSLMSMNNITKFVFNPEAYGVTAMTADYDDDTLMYVTNRPLRVVGELGNICYAPWATIRLYDHKTPWVPYCESGGKPVHPVFDYFMVTNKSYVRGLVNVNASNVSVLTSVLANIPLKEYDSSSTKRVPWNLASNLASAIWSHGIYTNISAVEAATNWAVFASNCYTAAGSTNSPTEIEKEAILRNAADLLTVRHNLFTIYLLADAYVEGKQGATGITLASARAVAEVWRDPFRDPASGKHKYMIRQFKLLDD